MLEITLRLSNDLRVKSGTVPKGTVLTVKLSLDGLSDRTAHAAILSDLVTQMTKSDRVKVSAQSILGVQQAVATV